MSAGSELARVVRLPIDALHRRSQARQEQRHQEVANIRRMVSDLARLGGPNGAILTVYASDFVDHTSTYAGHLLGDLRDHRDIVYDDTSLPFLPPSPAPEIAGRVKPVQFDPMRFPRIGQADITTAADFANGIGFIRSFKPERLKPALPANAKAGEKVRRALEETFDFVPLTRFDFYIGPDAAQNVVRSKYSPHYRFKGLVRDDGFAPQTYQEVFAAAVKRAHARYFQHPQ